MFGGAVAGKHALFSAQHGRKQLPRVIDHAHDRLLLHVDGMLRARIDEHDIMLFQQVVSALHFQPDLSLNDKDELQFRVKMPIFLGCRLDFVLHSL